MLDQDVNAPNWVKPDFNKALDKFYEKNPDAGDDPGYWDEEDRKEYEPLILKEYEAVRRGTDMKNRAENLKKSDLSKSPGSIDPWQFDVTVDIY